jgi:penicillin-binding protein 1A
MSRSRLALVPGIVLTATVGGVLLALAVVGLWAVGLGVAAGAHGVAAPIVMRTTAQTSEVFARDGSVLAVLHAGEDRKDVKLNQVAPVLVQAVIDTEDSRYWTHGGADLRGIYRALAADVHSGSIQEGGSTIAQQLVKNTVLSSSRALSRKIEEVVVADRLVAEIGKPAVLEKYLNTIYFGDGAYGVEAAAEHYFGVSAAKVDVAQAGMLAGIIRDPEAYDPFLHRANALDRRRVVLDLMVHQGHLTADQATRADGERLPLAPTPRPAGRDFFTDAVVQQLLADPRVGRTTQDRYNAVFGGGLRIRTTMDPTLQWLATASIRTGLPADHQELTAAMVAVDPSSGAVRALVGGPNFDNAQFDPVIEGAGRQPGSSFKPFTLVTALEEGYSPMDIIDGDTPCTIPNPQGTPNPWMPQNFEGERFGYMSLTDATAFSVNCAYARLALGVGLGNIADTAHAMGVKSHLDVVPAMSLGSDVVTPEQMASAYATLAADGVYHPPYLIDEVDRADGSPIFKNRSQSHQVIPPQIAREVTQVLEQVVIKGTGTAASLGARPVAGKTGTASDYQDAWFDGYTPQLATSVWMGNLHAESPMRDIDGINVVGGSYPARIWNSFMSDALRNDAIVPFTPPDPSLIPYPVVLVDGQPRPATAPGGSAPGPLSTLPPPTDNPPPTGNPPPTDNPPPPPATTITEPSDHYARAAPRCSRMSAASSVGFSSGRRWAAPSTSMRRAPAMPSA